ncbi:MAG: acyltransferase family protein, partial [Verrucomicrobiota bacterium]
AVASASGALYAWLMIFALFGLFRRFFSGERRWLRYLSDSAYWLYLAHLPLVIGFQILVSPWQVPGWIKFLLILVTVTGVLLLTYEWGVRYRWIGAILNGRKVRQRYSK